MSEPSISEEGSNKPEKKVITVEKAVILSQYPRRTYLGKLEDMILDSYPGARVEIRGYKRGKHIDSGALLILEMFDPIQRYVDTVKYHLARRQGPVVVLSTKGLHNTAMVIYYVDDRRIDGVIYTNGEGKLRAFTQKEYDVPVKKFLKNHMGVIKRVKRVKNG